MCLTQSGTAIGTLLAFVIVQLLMVAVLKGLPTQLMVFIRYRLFGRFFPGRFNIDAEKHKRRDRIAGILFFALEGLAIAWVLLGHLLQS